MGTVVPPEQVTYLHYLSSHQRRLQQLLELEVRANRLSQFIAEADRFCYVDSVRTSCNLSYICHPLFSSGKHCSPYALSNCPPKRGSPCSSLRPAQKGVPSSYSSILICPFSAICSQRPTSSAATPSPTRRTAWKATILRHTFA